MIQARSRQAVLTCSRPDATAVAAAAAAVATSEAAWMMGSAPLRAAVVRQQLFFPDRRLIQFDCGKLQVRLKLNRVFVENTWSSCVRLRAAAGAIEASFRFSRQREKGASSSCDRLSMK